MAKINDVDGLAGLMDQMFRYRVGDLVCLRVQHEQRLAHMKINFRSGSGVSIKEAQAAMIVERKVVQCHGGVQTYYAVAEGQSIEAELMPWAESVEALSKAADEWSVETLRKVLACPGITPNKAMSTLQLEMDRDDVRKALGDWLVRTETKRDDE